ncbi:alpha-1,2-fucosyltransferase [Butyrivibrio sp. LC3010]|uniref:alpha-1,2-fucosyltransferase n=1 Tax=Butyrivibrio sp. LC3010 TaxID=1280680 RepID=UPI0004023622|nr:alpha-1,2-fucosyltransferase [Butyrivibrio sp. LC3010]
MVFVRIMGGLGNQLFQYSVGYALSQRENQDLVLDYSYFGNNKKRQFKLHFMNIPNDVLFMDGVSNIWCSLLKNKFLNKGLRVLGVENPYIGENKLYILESRFIIMDSFYIEGASLYYLDGYFQSPKYFEKYRSELIKQFQFGDEITHSVEKYINEVRKNESVAVHVRRGDFLTARNDYTGFHYLLDASYYNKAFMYINDRLNDPVFYCFSDDIDWMRNVIDERYNIKYITIRDSNSDLKEFEIMKNCKHFITANSTYSWWASWLNTDSESIHIVPSRPYGNDEMIPNSWIKL